MKFGLVIRYNLRNKCSKIKTHAKNKAARLVPDLLVLLKARGQHFIFSIFR